MSLCMFFGGGVYVRYFGRSLRVRLSFQRSWALCESFTENSNIQFRNIDRYDIAENMPLRSGYIVSRACPLTPSIAAEHSSRRGVME
jgi:hypothetical protein